jgi:hypothetical protein
MTHFLNGIIEKFIFLFGLTDIGYFYQGSTAK